MFSTNRLISGETRRVVGESRALPRAETACPLPRDHIATAALMSREARTRASPCLRWDWQSTLQLEALNLCVTLRADALRLMARNTVERLTPAAAAALMRLYMARNPPLRSSAVEESNHRHRWLRARHERPCRSRATDEC